MKVLLLGATGNVGSRVLPALLTHNHQVVAYVRSSGKLESILPSSVYQQVQVVQGNATDSTAIKNAILDHRCDAVINTAGLAAMMPWQSSDLPVIFRSVVDAVRDVGRERGQPLRAWFLGGMGVLNLPGTENMLLSYMPIFPTHRQNIKLLRSLPPNSIDWSMLCPSEMSPESSDLSVPTKPSSHGKLVASAESLPHWHDSWVRHIPLLGNFIWIGMNATRYSTTLEQNAELIASDLENPTSAFIGKAVGVIDATR